MNLFRLGDSELEISQIGIGCMSLTGGPNASNNQVLHKAFDAGINYFDTADIYEKGRNETMLGTAVQSFRQDVIVATKVGNKAREDGKGNDWKASKSYILKEVDNSLLRLKTDYVDLYQLHGGTKEDDFEGIVEAFELLVEAGKIRAYGISSIRPNVFTKYATASAICANMMQYSLLDRRPEEYFEDLEANQVSVVTRGSLAQGLLIDKPAKEYLQYSSGEVGAVRRSIHSLAKELNISAEAAALSYVLSHRAVASAVVGIRSAAQLDDLLKAKSQIQKFSDIECTRIINDIRSIAYTEHR